MSNRNSTQIDAGGMGTRIGSFDWASTPLGRIGSWSPALRANVELMLGQRHPICIFWGPDLTLLYNDAYVPTLGLKEAGALGQPARKVWSDVWDAILPFVEQAMSGQGTWSEELPLETNRNGFPEQTYWTFSYSPLYEDGAVKGMINVALDATAGVRSRQREAALQKELIHRVKNMIAVTAAVVSSSLRNASSLDEARTIVAQRLTALGKAQNLLHGVADTISLRDIVNVALEAHIDHPQRVSIEGLDLIVAPQQAVGLSLALYELATNAVKYGAFANDEGRVKVSWHHNSGEAFAFVWEETGGPLVAKPSKAGFGSRLINSIVPSYFSGVGATRYDESGIRYELNGVLSKPGS